MDIDKVTTIFRRNMARLAAESVAARRRPALAPVAARAGR
jgi:hypothetical protein